MPWAFIPATGKGWGKSKGGKSAGGKGKGKVLKGGKRGKKGGDDKKVPYSELSEEKRAEIREKHDARAADEGRETVGNTIHLGTLLKRGRFNGWIKPTNPGKFPASVKAKLKEMTAAHKAKHIENGSKGQFDEGRIYVRMCDVNEGVKVDTGMSLKFKVYVDAEGVGAYEVDEA